MISKPFTDINFETMQGMCYSGEISSNALFIENNLKSYSMSLMLHLIKSMKDVINNYIILII